MLGGDTRLFPVCKVSTETVGCASVATLDRRRGGRGVRKRRMGWDGMGWEE